MSMFPERASDASIGDILQFEGSIKGNRIYSLYKGKRYRVMQVANGSECKLVKIAPEGDLYSSSISGTWYRVDNFSLVERCPTYVEGKIRDGSPVRKRDQFVILDSKDKIVLYSSNTASVEAHVSKLLVKNPEEEYAVYGLLRTGVLDTIPVKWSNNYDAPDAPAAIEKADTVYTAIFDHK